MLYIFYFYKILYYNNINIFIFLQDKFFTSTMCNGNDCTNISSSSATRTTRYFTFFRCKQQIIMECNYEQIRRWYVFSFFLFNITKFASSEKNLMEKNTSANSNIEKYYKLCRKVL